jgi:hypothetical protein
MTHPLRTIFFAALISFVVPSFPIGFAAQPGVGCSGDTAGHCITAKREKRTSTCSFADCERLTCGTCDEACSDTSTGTCSGACKRGWQSCMGTCQGQPCDSRKKSRSRY